MDSKRKEKTKNKRSVITCVSVTEGISACVCLCERPVEKLQSVRA